MVVARDRAGVARRHLRVEQHAAGHSTRVSHSYKTSGVLLVKRSRAILSHALLRFEVHAAFRRLGRVSSHYLVEQLSRIIFARPPGTPTGRQAGRQAAVVRPWLFREGVERRRAVPARAGVHSSPPHLTHHSRQIELPPPPPCGSSTAVGSGFADSKM